MDPSVDTAIQPSSRLEDRDVADHSRSIADPTLLHWNANAFRSRCVEESLGCSHIRTIRARASDLHLSLSQIPMRQTVAFFR
jgi:hypothetical protein